MTCSRYTVDTKWTSLGLAMMSSIFAPAVARSYQGELYYETWLKSTLGLRSMNPTNYFRLVKSVHNEKVTAAMTLLTLSHLQKYYHN